MRTTAKHTHPSLKIQSIWESSDPQIPHLKLWDIKQGEECLIKCGLGTLGAFHGWAHGIKDSLKRQIRSNLRLKWSEESVNA